MRSDKPPGPYTIEQMADDTEGLLDVLRIERAVVVGYSMGGRTALSLALGHSTRVRRLVLAATSASTPPSRILSRRWLALEVLSRLPTPGERQPRWAWECQRRASASYDATARVGEIVVPTLILHGRRDHDASRTGAVGCTRRSPDLPWWRFPVGISRSSPESIAASRRSWRPS